MKQPTYKIVDHFNGHEYSQHFTNSEWPQAIQVLDEKRAAFYAAHTGCDCTLGLTSADDVWQFNHEQNKWMWMRPD